MGILFNKFDKASKERKLDEMKHFFYPKRFKRIYGKYWSFFKLF